MLINIILLALYLFIAVCLGALVFVVGVFWLGDDTDDLHKPDACPPELPPHQSLPVIPHIDLYA